MLEVLEANHNRRPLSLDRPVGGEDSEESPAAEWVGDEDAGYELVEDKLALEGALPHLDERERLVLQLRFVEDLTQSQIAERIGHSQMHVSRILRRTLERIRAEVAEQSAAAGETESAGRAQFVESEEIATTRYSPSSPSSTRSSSVSASSEPPTSGSSKLSRRRSAPPWVIGPTLSSIPFGSSAMLSETWPSVKPCGARAEIASLSSIVSERRSTLMSWRAARAPRGRG